MDRINVVGTSCSGKTTLARAIAERLDLPYTELDALFWGPGWESVPSEVFHARVADAVRGERWVIDGAYTGTTVGPLIWSRADTIVWLDYPLPLVLARWAGRTVARIRSQEEFWPGTGNRESIGNALRGGGLVWWILRTHHGRRRRIRERLLAETHVQSVRLRSPHQTDRWLAKL